MIIFRCGFWKDDRIGGGGVLVGYIERDCGIHFVGHGVIIENDVWILVDFSS